MSKPSNKIVLFGLFGVGNLGNDASLESFLDFVRINKPNLNISCVCGNPQEVSKKYNLTAIPFDSDDAEWMHQTNKYLRVIKRLLIRIGAEVNFWSTRISWLQENQKLIVVGTGILDDFGVKPWNMPYDLFKWCLAARIAGIKLIFISVGVGPIKNRINRFLMLYALRLADYRSYRDKVSYEYLNSVGFNTQNDKIVPDLVFSHPGAIRSGGGKNPKSQPKTVGLGVMGYYGWENNPSQGEAIYQSYVSKLKAFVRWLLNSGYHIRLLMGELPVDQRPIDELLNYVHQDLPDEQSNRIIANPIYEIKDLFDEIADTDLVVGTRFHNVLCSLMLGRPVVSIGYSSKNDALMAEMGLQNYCHHIEHLEIEQLKQDFQMLVEEHNKLVPQIQKKANEYFQELNTQYINIL